MKTKILIGLFFAAVMGMLLELPGAASAGGVVVIANKNVSASSLSIEEVKNIFLSKKTQWRDGSKIEFVALESGATQDDFLSSYLQKTSSQYDRYFRTLVFTGKGKAPRTFSTEAEVISYVSSTAGAIGYVSSETNTRSAKVITVN